MKKRIKKVGSGLGIYLSKEEVAIYGLQIGDVVVVEKPTPSAQEILDQINHDKLEAMEKDG